MDRFPISSGKLGVALFTLSAAIILLTQQQRRRQKTESQVRIININETVTVSCPGKVLIAGGYLVLERPNVGITIAGTSRFYTTVKFFPTTESNSRSSSQRSTCDNILRLVVYSPQFYEEYRFDYNFITEQIVVAADSSSNAFVEKCLSMTMGFIKNYMGANNFESTLKSMAVDGYLAIKLRADNDFYSQAAQLKKAGKPLLTSSLEELPPFQCCPKDECGKAIVAKTGLGSSAALTTSLVGALLQWFGIVRLGYRWSEEDRRIVHNLAQLVHANAQGKIGSGFDVASAVYGTQVYQRFSQEPFTSCLEDTVGGKLIYDTVTNTSLWNQEVIPFNLPPGIDIILCDVCGGSSSTSMAKAVLKWKKDCKLEADALWKELSDVNLNIYDGFRQLNNQFTTNPQAYVAAIEWASKRSADCWKDEKTHEKTLEVLYSIREHFLSARKLLKCMGQNSGVEIEPDEQTTLADSTMGIEGVLAAGVPGAGGQDALFAIVLSHSSRQQVEQLWSGWGSDSVLVCPLMLRAATKDRSGVQPEFEMQW